MFPRRLLISPAASVVIRRWLFGLALLVTLGGCAGEQPISGTDAASSQNPTSPSPAAANASDSAVPPGSQGDSAAIDDEDGAVAESAEAFANRVEQRLQQEDGAATERDRPAQTGRRRGASEETVRWESQLRQAASDAQPTTPSEPREPHPPMRSAADDSSGESAADSQPSPTKNPSADAPETASAGSPDPPDPSDEGDPEPSETASASAPPDEADSRSEAESGSEPEKVDLDRLGLDQLLDGVRQRLRDEAASEPDTLRPYLALGALSVLDPERTLSESELANLDAETRRALLAYQEAFAGLGRSLDESGSAGVRPMREAADQLAEDLRKNQPLRIHNARLCRRVDGYGVYTPFADQRFVAGREQPVIVYAELENFTPEQDDDGRYLVRLSQRIVLYNESDGLAVWRPSSSETKIVDRSRNRRRDFFVVQVIRLPARLTVGKYLLKLTITDEIGQSLDEATIPIRIVADSEVASGSNR